LDLEGKKLFLFRAKNKAVKIHTSKIIDLLPDLSSMDPNHYLFTQQLLDPWKRRKITGEIIFLKNSLVKDHLLNKGYGLYSLDILPLPTSVSGN
jgi:hypothetical protein